MTDKTICYCIGVSERAIVAAIHKGATTLKSIQDTTGACTGGRCKELNPSGTCCSRDILELIEQEAGRRPSTRGGR